MEKIEEDTTWIWNFGINVHADLGGALKAHTHDGHTHEH